jgi:transposase
MNFCEAGMSHEIRADYSQVLMFPPSVEDWVGPKHPARFIREMVDSLDLGAMGFHIPDPGPGRPGYAADLMLKVWLYGYFHRIRSTRKLEMACREHMGLIWLTGMKVPDHSVLSRFMDSNKQAISGLFKQSVQVAAKCKLIGMVVNAVDGTKIRSASSRDRFMSSEGLEKMLESLDQSIADFMAEVERLEQEEIGEYKLPSGMDSILKRKEKIQKALIELQESGQKRVHSCEPEVRFMRNRRSIEPSYNGQAVADKDNGIIVAQDVVTDGTDNGQLVPMLDQVKENLGEVAQETLADSGYYSSAQIGLAQERSYEVLVNAPSSDTTASRIPASNPYHTAWFIYDEDRNCLICPHGQVLPYCNTKARGKNGDQVRIYRCRKYRTCPHRWECSRSKRGREIELSVYLKEVEQQRVKRENPTNKQLLKRRKTIIEPVFAWIKRHLGFDRWTVFGLEKVRAQWALVCAVINMKKLYKCWLSGGLQLTAH